MLLDQTISPKTPFMAEDMRVALTHLGLSQSAFARRMSKLGDHRSTESILRSVQRMVTGDSAISGEMKVILFLLRKELVRIAQKNVGLGWVVEANGSVNTISDGFRITISPQSKGRWAINLIHEGTGYSPPWPTWQPSLEHAKARALSAVEEALEELVELELA